MPALQVRDFPDELYSELKSYAAANHRSIAQQTIACVEEVLSRIDQVPLTQTSPEESDIEVSAQIAEAAHRARSVDPFVWKRGLGREPEEVIAARRKKRAGLQKSAEKIRGAWKGNTPTPSEIAQLIREERDARSAAVAVGMVDTYVEEAI